MGAERTEEFTFAGEQAARCREVTVVNPRVTVAARQFAASGGNFVASRIEDLPSDLACFHEIRENYPYPSGRHYVPPQPFVRARLSRLAPGGRWILFTESPRYASLLRAAVDYHPRIAPRFRVRLAVVPANSAPPSDYPRRPTRYRLIFERRS